MKPSHSDCGFARAYAQLLTRPIKYGENGVFFWVPGTGMTTIVQGVFNLKGILQAQLSSLARNIIVISFWGHVSEKKTATDLFRSSGFSDYFALEQQVIKLVDYGKEVVCIVGRCDDYSEAERISILKSLVRLNSKNRRRIHILLHMFDKPWFEQQLVEHPEFIVLANHMELVPIPSGKVLSNYITEQAAKFGTTLTSSQLKEATQTYGGITQLTKEYLRSHGNSRLLDLKVKVNWNNLPPTYRLEIEDYLIGNSSRNQSSAVRDLKEFGVWDLMVFKKHLSALQLNSENLLPKLLTTSEMKLWEYLNSHTSEIVNKEVLIGILRPGSQESLSLWALDQAISRFRKKLAKAGIDYEQLRTVKGKGYIWK